MDWTTAAAKVDLVAESVVTMTSNAAWTVTYTFTADYKVENLSGRHRLALAMAPSMGVSPGGSGSSLSSSAPALGLSLDPGTGLYAISAADGRLLTADGRAAALRDADGSESQLWSLRAAEGGYVVWSASTGIVLDSTGLDRPTRRS